jgi:hypothetical protein
MSTKILKKQKFLTARLNDNLKDITDLKERIAEGIDVDFTIKLIYEIYEAGYKSALINNCIDF